MNDNTKPSNSSVGLFAEFQKLIHDCELEELRLRETDLLLKTSNRGSVGIQGMILDAMHDGRLKTMQAHRLLVSVNHRINGNSVGLCRVTPDGDLIAFGFAAQS